MLLISDNDIIEEKRERNMIKAKIISSLEKCFVGDDVDKFEQIKSITARYRRQT